MLVEPVIQFHDFAFLDGDYMTVCNETFDRPWAQYIISTHFGGGDGQVGRWDRSRGCVVVVFGKPPVVLVVEAGGDPCAERL
jgi:hypothetical protein